MLEEEKSSIICQRSRFQMDGLQDKQTLHFKGYWGIDNWQEILRMHQLFWELY